MEALKKGLIYLRMIVKELYSKLISCYIFYVLVGILLTPYIAIMAAIDDGWFREFKYDTFKRRMKK